MIVGCGYWQGLLPTHYCRDYCPATIWWEFTRVRKQKRIGWPLRCGKDGVPGLRIVGRAVSLKPQYLVRLPPCGDEGGGAAGVANGTSIVTLSIGAFADSSFLEEVKAAALQHGTKVYIASGATGGFDVLRTATLMGNVSAQFLNQKGVSSFKGTSFYTPEMERANQLVFSGTAREAIQTFPTGLNVAVAASLATVGPEELNVTMESTPDFVETGSGWR